jgi:putative DNA primase/helicase
MDDFAERFQAARKRVALRAVGRPLSTPPGELDRRAASADSITMQCMAGVKPTPVQWLWRDRIAAGKLTMIAGQAGAGKSTAVLDLVARITRGADWPDGGTAPRGDVVILSAEDGVSDTLVPRLIAAGADRERVYVVRQVVRADGGRRTFDLWRVIWPDSTAPSKSSSATCA